MLLTVRAVREALEASEAPDRTRQLAHDWLAPRCSGRAATPA